MQQLHHPCSSSAPLLLLFAAAFSFLWQNANSDMHCLVSRAGFGLVSEQCPPQTVGCRIRVQRSAVTFYEYLDGNQFVCVLKGEFGDHLRGSGCVRKRSGNIRCWCFGHSNCNTVETSKLIYQAFVSGNQQNLLEAIQKVDFADLVKEEKNAKGLTTIATRNNSTPAPTLMDTKIAKPFHRPLKEQKSNSISDKTPMPTPKITQITTTKASPPPSSSGSNSGTLQSAYDQKNRVHVIHVSSRDQYEPVFGSAALRRIMAQEAERLKAESEDIAAEVQDDYDEADEEEESEELSSSSAMLVDDDATAGGVHPRQRSGGAPISRRVAQRSELAKPKAIRMEQREKSSTSASGEGDMANALGDEFFDSSFFAPKSSSCRPTTVTTTQQFELAVLALCLALCSLQFQ